MKPVYKRMEFNHSPLVVPRAWIAVFFTGLCMSCLLFFSFLCFIMAEDQPTETGTHVAYILGVIFILVYVAFVTFSYISTSDSHENHKIAKSYSESPWMWRKDWREKCIVIKPSTGFKYFVGIGVIAGILLLPKFILLVRRLFDGDFSFGMLFSSEVIASIVMIAYVSFLYRMNQYRTKVNVVRFYMNDLPISNERLFTGEIVGFGKLEHAQEVELMLFCDETTFDHKGKPGKVKTLWQSRETFEISQRDGAGDLVMPYSFKVPDGLPETNYNGDVIYTWYLQVVTEDILAVSIESFEIISAVPVFFDGFTDEV